MAKLRTPERAAYEKAWREANQDRVRAHHLKHTYGMEPQDYDAMLASQGGVCAICHEPETNKRLAVDHDHTNGCIRGLLCSHCNTALGKFRDDPKRLASAINYLNHHWTALNPDV